MIHLFLRRQILMSPLPYADGHLSETTGFLSSLMGVGKECHGYKICIAGHSLGGSVATLLGIRVRNRSVLVFTPNISIHLTQH